MTKSFFKSTHYAVYISVGYGLFSILYIITSGEFAARVARSQSELVSIEAYKGVFFVILTSVLIFFIARYFLLKISEVAVNLLKTQEAVQVAEKRALAGALASSISHDANNVLGTIFLRFESLQKKVTFTEDQTQDVAVILNSVKQLSSLIKRANTVGRLRKKSNTKSAHKFSQCIQEVLQLAAYHEKCTSVRFETENLLENDRATFDSEQFSQMLLNLLVNACEAFSESEKKLTRAANPKNETLKSAEKIVLIEILKEGENVVINVHDNGEGVAKGETENILNPFYSTKQSGAGLGLMSVLMFTEDHQGKLHVGRSSKLGGALFSVYFLAEPSNEFGTNETRNRNPI